MLMPLLELAVMFGLHHARISPASVLRLPSVANQPDRGPTRRSQKRHANTCIFCSLQPLCLLETTLPLYSQYFAASFPKYPGGVGIPDGLRDTRVRVGLSCPLDRQHVSSVFATDSKNASASTFKMNRSKFIRLKVLCNEQIRKNGGRGACNR